MMRVAVPNMSVRLARVANHRSALALGARYEKKNSASSPCVGVGDQSSSADCTGPGNGAGVENALQWAHGGASGLTKHAAVAASAHAQMLRTCPISRSYRAVLRRARVVREV